MILITSDQALLKHVPNVLATVTGEKTLFEKLSPWLGVAESWVAEQFTSQATLTAIAAYADNNPVKSLASRVVVCEAMRLAVPSLDIVLTPNGFGIVSNSNIAPASKERVERLIASLEESRDTAIGQLLTGLATVEGWRSTPQHGWFHATLFTDLSVVAQCGFSQHRWERYLQLREKIAAVEQSLAEDFLSPELMESWRTPGNVPELAAATINQVKNEIVRVLNGEPISTRRMMDIVNTIRNNDDVFPEWKTSDTAKLFSPPKFVNKKEAKGYWF